MGFVHQEHQRSFFFFSFKLYINREITPRVELREAEAFREGKGNCTKATPLDCRMRPVRAKQMLAAGWLLKFVVGRKIFKLEIGSEGRGCYMGKESRPAGHQTRCCGCAESWGARSSCGLGKHGVEAGCLIAPPTPDFHAQNHQTTSPVAYVFGWLPTWLFGCLQFFNQQ